MARHVNPPLLLDLTLIRVRSMTAAAFREKSQPRNWMEMRVRSDASAGLLLLQHSSGTADDDFLAIAVRDGRVEVALNLGKDRPRDPLVIRSNVVVADRRWHTITFTR